ncbi:hypothetical protein EZV62_000670 [Acer yangbiense]|uniref:CCHC-type domain-containing protein n=1 Tax=Acer yangbiense TaxID=1000413 RepID=A0A5C7IS51_9ROSI|nr:hypothetical protein EZV62_000670 [Acer yangbiense]
MAKFAAALLVLCLVFVAAVQVPQVHAADVYGNCLLVCLKVCEKDNGYTFCEMKCDTDCFNKEIEATSSKDKKRKRGKEAAAGTSQHKVQKKQDEVFTCYFCKKAGHMKKDCPKYANWRVKKGMLLALVCSEARPYKPNERKLDSRTVSCYFVGYSERSRGFKFYDPTAGTFFETGNARFLEEVEFMGGDEVRNIVFEEEFISLPIAIDNDQVSVPDIVRNANPEYQDNVEELLVQNDEIIPEVQIQQPQEDMPLRRSTRERRNAIPDDYVVFLQEHEGDIGVMEDDPINFHQAKQTYITVLSSFDL